MLKAAKRKKSPNAERGRQGSEKKVAAEAGKERVEMKSAGAKAGRRNIFKRLSSVRRRDYVVDDKGFGGGAGGRS
jgi:hypothetical protein